MLSVVLIKTFASYHLDMTRRVWDSIDQITEVTSSFPPDDESSSYPYKVRSSGLADFSRLRTISTGINPRATTARAGKNPRNHLVLEVQGLEV